MTTTTTLEADSVPAAPLLPRRTTAMQPAECPRTRAGPEAPPPPSAPDPRAPPPLAPTGSPSCPRAREPGGRRPRRHSRPSAAHAGASRAPRSTGRRPGALPRRLVTRAHTHTHTHTHPAAQPGRAGRRAYLKGQVALARGGVCSGAPVIRTAAAVQGSQTPLGSLPLQHVTPHTHTHTHTHPGRTAASFLPLPRPEEEVLENENSVEGREPRPSPLRPLTPQCLLCLANSPESSTGSAPKRAEGGAWRRRR